MCIMSDVPRESSIKQLIWYWSVVVSIIVFFSWLIIAWTNLSRDVQNNREKIEAVITKDDVVDILDISLEKNNLNLVNKLKVVFDERYQKKK